MTEGRELVHSKFSYLLCVVISRGRKYSFEPNPIPGTMIIIRLMTFFVLISAIACKSIPFSPENYRDNYIVMGEGGGFAGVETHHFITLKGDVFRRVAQDTLLQKLPAVSQRLVDQVMNTVEQLDLINYEYNRPGNTYKFLHFYVDGKDQKVVWSGNDQEVNPACQNLFTLLKRSIKE